MIVVAGIERDPLRSAGLDDSTHHVKGSIPVERRDLDRHDVVDRRETAPEGERQDETANRRLQIEADKRDFTRDRGCVRDQFVFRRALHRRERQEAGMIVEPSSDLRFAHGLFRAAGKSGDHDRGRRRPFSGRAHRDLQHRCVQTDVTNCELGRVHADGEAARARIEIVASKRPLPTCVELTLAIQCKRVSRNDRAAPQRREHLLRPVRPVQSNLSRHSPLALLLRDCSR